MRFILFLLGAILLYAVASPPASMASGSAWCAHYGFDLGGTNCGFTSYEQCMASLTGNGGVCLRNSQYQPGGFEPAPRRSRRHP